jgi:hypothetical protein
MRIWSPVDFQGHRSKVTWSNLYAWGYTTLCVALVINQNEHVAAVKILAHFDL